MTEIYYGAVGDVGTRTEDPDYHHKEPVFAYAAPILKQLDIASCQFERILSPRLHRPYYEDAVVPENARTLAEAGFNVISVAGNHHMDAGVEAFLDTLESLRKYHMKPFGVGMNIKEARTPVIVEKKGTKVGFLGYSSIIPKGEIPYDAEANRPGCAPMYISTFYEASDWQPGTPSPRVVSMANPEDLEAMKEDIKRAKAMADVVVMYIHWGVHHLPGYLAMYQFEVGHAAIDAGVDVVMGSHPHILKGIEVYKGKVIFYSLGNFGMQSPVRKSQSGRWDATFRPKRDPNDLGAHRFFGDARKTIMAKCVIANKRIERVSFLPFMINDLAQPQPLPAADSGSNQVLEYVAWCCQDQKLDTKFVRDGDEIVIRT
ncbi:MAG: CapA family protein [Chloroflexi bacterium]|nr:CapA family protein [Chloroflexota bacterium]